MKNRISIKILLSLLAITLRAQEPPLAGKWSGVLDTGSAKLRMGLDITRGTNGAFSATMSVVKDQNVSSSA